MTRCVTETLRLWPVVPNGTFRQLSYEDEVKGPGGKMVKLPRGTIVQVTTVGRHRDTKLWGDDAAVFNPVRARTTPTACRTLGTRRLRSDAVVRTYLRTGIGRMMNSGTIRSGRRATRTPGE
jgi:cytochrome P450